MPATRCVGVYFSLLTPHAFQGNSMSYFKHHVFFCTNQRQNGEACCQDHGANDMRAYAKDRVKQLAPKELGRIRINSAGCLDRCELGPCMVIYPEGIWYKIETTADVDLILERHVRDGNRVPELMLPAE